MKSIKKVNLGGLTKLNIYIYIFGSEQFMSLKMNEGIYIHINKVNKCITYLLSIKVNSEEEDEIIILLASLSK